MINIRIAALRKEAKLTQEELAKLLGVGRTTVNGYEKGIISPPPDKISRMAETFNVTTDYLLGNNTLNKKDNSDIAYQMGKILQELKLDQNALTFNGEELDSITRELLIQSLQNSLEIGKTISKKKYTPNKYRKE